MLIQLSTELQVALGALWLATIVTIGFMVRALGQSARVNNALNSTILLQTQQQKEYVTDRKAWEGERRALETRNSELERAIALLSTQVEQLQRDVLIAAQERAQMQSTLQKEVAQAQPAREKVEAELTGRLNIMQTDSDQKQARILALEAKVDELRQQINSKDALIEKLNQRIDTLEREGHAKDTQIAAMQASLESKVDKSNGPPEPGLETVSDPKEDEEESI